MKNVDLDDQLHFLTMYISDALNANETERSDYQGVQRSVRNTTFLLEELKNFESGKTWRKDGCVVLRCGRGCSKMRCEMCGLTHSNYTQFEVLAWMITISRKRNLHRLVNCPKYAPKLS